MKILSMVFFLSYRCFSFLFFFLRVILERSFSSSWSLCSNSLLYCLYTLCLGSSIVSLMVLTIFNSLVLNKSWILLTITSSLSDLADRVMFAFRPAWDWVESMDPRLLRYPGDWDGLLLCDDCLDFEFLDYLESVRYICWDRWVFNSS